LELEEKRRENNIKGKLGDEGFKKYKDLKQKIYESRNLNSKVKIIIISLIIFTY
jgi:hypothetical protein